MAEPKIRFMRDDGSSFPAYQAKCLGDFFNERNERASGEEKLLAVTQSRGIVLQNDTDKRNVSNPDKSNYKVVRVGDIAYNTMRMWQGAEGVSVYDGIVSPAYTVVFSRAAIDVFYFEKYFKTNKMLKTFERYSQGLTSDTWNLKYPLFSKILVNVPCFEEQRKIADFLSSVDEVIAASEQEVANLETQKKALMKKIFSQEVRFKREDGTDFPDWEECELGTIASAKVGSKPEIIIEEQTEYEYINAGTTNSGYTNSSNRDGNVVTTPSRGQGGIGFVGYKGKPFWLGPLCYGIQSCEEDVLTKYLYFCLDYNSSKIMSCVKTGSIPAVNQEDLVQIVLGVPCLEEQRLIIDFLSNFDEAIAAAKKELDLWKELKKGLLQQMFV